MNVRQGFIPCRPASGRRRGGQWAVSRVHARGAEGDEPLPYVRELRNVALSSWLRIKRLYAVSSSLALATAPMASGA